MIWKQIPLGIIQTNCYCIIEKEECIIIDPGDEAEKLIHWLDENSLTPLAILLTHAHFDHIGAVDALRDQYNIPAYVHSNEASWIGDAYLNSSSIFFPKNPITIKEADYYIDGEKVLNIGTFSFDVIETPGHSPGSISFYMKDEKIIFSGDALFSGSIGRTDLPGGNYEQLMKSIKEKLMSLPDETMVLSGHGPVTTIGREKSNNPFLTAH